MRAAWLILVVLVACASEPVFCPGAGGFVCPIGTTCGEQICVVEAGACRDFPEGSLCGDGTQVCRVGACVPAACGDGVLDTRLGEVCDEGANNSDLEPDACRTTCRPATCGDGVMDFGEESYCLSRQSEIAAPALDMRLERALLGSGNGIDLLGSYLDAGEGVVVRWRVPGGIALELAEEILRTAPRQSVPAFASGHLDQNIFAELYVDDLDGRGRPIIRVVEEEADGWQEGAPLLPLGRVTDLAIDDLDGDGFYDLVATTVDQGRGFLEIFAGRPDGLPDAAPTVRYGIDFEVLSLVLGDIDFDGDVDAVITVENAGQTYLRRWWNDGISGFRFEDDDPLRWEAQGRPILADVGDDDRPEICFVTSTRTTVVDPEGRTTLLPGSRSLAAVDVDGDDIEELVRQGPGSDHLVFAEDLPSLDVDLVVSQMTSVPASSYGARPDLVVLGTGPAGTPRLVLFAVGRDSPLSPVLRLENPYPFNYDPSVADLDGDGINEVLTSSNNELCVQRDPTSRALGTVALDCLTAGPGVLYGHITSASADLDGDQRADILQLAAPGGEGTLVTLGVSLSGDLPPVLAEPSKYPLDHQADRLRLGDVDGDGDLDVAAIDAATGNWSLHVNRDGLLQPLPSDPLADAAIRDVILADVDGDGRADALLVADGGLFVLHGDGGGGFSAGEEIPDVKRVVAADLRGDPAVELAVLDAAGFPRVLERKGGTWHEVWRSPDVALDLDLADINGDGRIDLLKLDVGRLDVHLQTESGGFARAQRRRVPTDPSILDHLGHGDVDSDGNIDVLVYGEYFLGWLHANGSGTR